MMTTAKIDTSKLTDLHRQRIQEWCDALRGDRYTKATAVLHSMDDCYCVMGVACDISQLGTWQKYDKITSSDRPDCYQYVCNDSNWREWNHAALPKSVFEHYGFHLVDVTPWMMESNVLVNSKTSYGLTNISNLNDGTDMDFKAIADVIESTYLN